jgi:flagellar hook-associated protein 2
MSISPLTFTGVSTFSSSYQAILNRAVQIAQIPVTALQNHDKDVLSKETLLGSLNSAVAALSTSLGSLGTTAANKALGATSSNPSVVSVQNTGATAPASYVINSITSPASAASERTTASFVTSNATAVSSTGTLNLLVGSTPHVFTLSSNNLLALRDKINSLGAGVTASILTTSPTTNYLSITVNTTGATTLQLIDDPVTPGNPGGANTNLLTATNQGANAVFQLNGINVSQASNVVNNVVPGLTFNILGASASPVTLALSSDRTALSTALQNFVTNHNAVAAQLTAQEGKDAGLLSGDSVIGQLSNALRQLTSYSTSSGSVNSLAALGIEFSSTGQASFNQTTFNALSDTNIADGFTFLGSATTGLGGFSQTFNQFSDPVTGFIKTEQDGLKRLDQSLQDQVNTLNDRITVMQNSLFSRLSAADAAVAALQSQQANLTTLLGAQDAAINGTVLIGGR